MKSDAASRNSPLINPEAACFHECEIYLSSGLIEKGSFTRSRRSGIYESKRLVLMSIWNPWADVKRRKFPPNWMLRHKCRQSMCGWCTYLLILFNRCSSCLITPLYFLCSVIDIKHLDSLS